MLSLNVSKSLLFEAALLSREGNTFMKLFCLGFGVSSNLPNHSIRMKCIGT